MLKSTISPNSKDDHASSPDPLEMPSATLGRYPHSRSLADLVADEAAASPGSLALVAGSRTMTYGELDSRSNQLAHHLIALGIEPGCFVAICLERAPETIVCALAALKAGGAFLPIDPRIPLSEG